MPRRWYVATTKSNCEMLADRELRKQGFRSFSPRVRERQVVRRKFSEGVRHVVRPYFPNYIFVNFDQDRDRWSPIKSTKGITRLISQGELLVPVRRGVIEALVESSGDENFLIDERVDEVIRQLCPGDQVRIVAGAFSGFEGSVESLVKGDRVRVMLQVFGRDNPVVLERGQVR